MDERDFAELISVFLKGSESTDELIIEENDEQASTTTHIQSNEAEIRKNIIEALAEKIRESQDKNPAQAERIEQTPAAEPERVKIEVETVEAPEASLDADNSLREGVRKDEKETASADTTGETVSADAAIDTETGTDTVTTTATVADTNTETDPVTGISNDLVTEEEVVTLLLGEDREEDASPQKILQRFLELDGIVAALLVSRDGFTVEHVRNIEFDLDMVSAIVATGFGSMDRIGNELGHGDLRIAMLEYLNGPIILAPLVPDIVLVIVASQWATIGRIRWEIKKQTDELIISL
jgi:predicted regulator of Ras-like GTPase activity (Roadblock/LC7/MglB family)